MSAQNMSVQNSQFDVIIIGGGPAGVVAARYCLHAQLQAALVTPELGRPISDAFTLRDLPPKENVWGAALIQQFEQEIAANPQLTHVSAHATRIQRLGSRHFQVALTDDRTIASRAIILATGAAPQRTYVAGEKEYWGRGVSFSTVSHAPYFAGRDVAVVGGGRRTLVAVLELAQIANRVYLIAAQPQIMAELPEAAKVNAQANVTAFINWEIQEIVGDEFVVGISLVGANGETRQLPVEGIFVDQALLPNNELVRELVELNADGHIRVNHRCETNVPGLFAAGDVTDIQAEQVLVAIGEGSKAALSAWEYLVTHS